MKSRIRHICVHLLALLLCVAAAFAQQNALAQDSSAFSREELDQMLAPIALYPDALLSHVLMAATYPIEVVEAARWSRAHPALNGEQAVKAVERKNWDDSVKSLVAFPRILMMMEEKLDWTERLGDAFLDQRPQVMDTVQYLRQKALAAGSLGSNEQVRVVSQDQVIMVELINPQVVYVPYYDPVVVYGPWWWRRYPPVYWAPWPGYYLVNGFAWGPGIFVGVGFFYAVFEWPHRYIYVANPEVHHHHTESGGSGSVRGAFPAWQHDPRHRRGVPYRGHILRPQSGSPALPAAQQDFRGYERLPQLEHGTPPAVPAEVSGSSGRVSLSAERHPGTRSAPAAGRARGRTAAERRPHVFEGLGEGADVRNFSARGQASSQRAAHAPAPHTGAAEKEAATPHRSGHEREKRRKKPQAADR